MATAKKIIRDTDGKIHEEGAHELGGTLGMAAAGTAGGIAGGVAAGVAAGAPLGPVGIVAGAAIGGAIGGIAGEAIAREINPTDEEKYWEEAFRNRSYVRSEHTFNAYRPAYRYGVDAYSASPERTYLDAREELSKNWEKSRGKSTLSWEEAEPATRDAYMRLYNREYL